MYNLWLLCSAVLLAFNSAEIISVGGHGSAPAQAASNNGTNNGNATVVPNVTVAPTITNITLNATVTTIISVAPNGTFNNATLTTINPLATNATNNNATVTTISPVSTNGTFNNVNVTTISPVNTNGTFNNATVTTIAPVTNTTLNNNETIATNGSECSSIPLESRIECLLPDALFTQYSNASSQEEKCALRKCCSDTSQGKFSCFFPNAYSSYELLFENRRHDRIEVMLQKKYPSGYDGEAISLRILVTYLTKDILRVKVVDPVKDRFEPPVPRITEYPPISSNISLDYEITVRNNPASFQIRRTATREVIFDTSIGALILSDRYLEISTRLPTSYLYGIGEHSDNVMRGGQKQTYTLFSRGELVPRNAPGFNLYGVHPFYINFEKSGKAHAVLLRNSNAMDIIVYESTQLTYRVIGGIFDFLFFLGPEPSQAIAQYTQTVEGHPFMPPYWSLGFHLCKYQYDSTQETRKVWKRNVDAGIPFDAQWSDIDYMEDRKDFTYDKVRYAGLPALVDEIHQAGMHYMMITDPGISDMEVPGAYQALDEAKALDILIRDADGDYLTGLVWQNITVFIDFSNPKSTDYWARQFKTLHDEVPFDGSWIDMNEPYSFVWGSHKGCPANNTYDYPKYYTPGNNVLYNGTICMSATQHIGQHYYAHNIYGLQEGISTNKAMREVVKKRPFVLSRSTFSGSGHYVGHWTGDVRSEWKFMKDSVERMVTFNMYGIPMVGSDICGFVGNTTYELCQRWTQLGAFMPFSRNHNDFDTVEQDPAFMGQEMVDLFKKVFGIRYYLLPYLYTLFYHSHTKGSTVLRPLFFEYLKDNRTYSIENTFFWGKGLLVIPVLEQGKTNVTTYIPKGAWYDYYSGEKLLNTGRDITFNAPADHINLLIHGGNIIPAQESAVTTTLSRKNPFNLIVALDVSGRAHGDLFWDDGDSIDTVESGSYNEIAFKAGNKTLNTKVVHRGYDTTMPLTKIIIHGVHHNVSRTSVNELESHFYHHLAKGILELDLSDASLLEENSIQWFE